MRKIIKGLGILVGGILLLLLVSFINHQFQLWREDEKFIPIGKQVTVNGDLMNVYSEGIGDQTLVFMSGGGTSSPVLDFITLSAHLGESYTEVIIEKKGYGFSEVSDVDRSIDVILSDTREALAASGFGPPYILVPHSMSGLEALYWAQHYPEEVEMIIGLDMAVPAAYKNYELNLPLIYLTKFAADIGVTRFIPGISESAAMAHGDLTSNEKELSEVIFYRRTITTPMLNEIKNVKENAEIVEKEDIPDVPILMFSSNGQETGFDPKNWKEIHNDFIEEAPKGEIIHLDVPHYLHNHAYEVISKKIDEYLGLY